MSDAVSSNPMGYINPVRSAKLPTGVNKIGSVPFSVKETGDELPCKSPRHNALTCLVPSLMVCWLSHGHRCLPFGDSTQMMPQPTFTENGTDPGIRDEVW